MSESQHIESATESLRAANVWHYTRPGHEEPPASDWEPLVLGEATIDSVGGLLCIHSRRHKLILDRLEAAELRDYLTKFIDHDPDENLVVALNEILGLSGGHKKGREVSRQMIDLVRKHDNRPA